MMSCAYPLPSFSPCGRSCHRRVSRLLPGDLALYNGQWLRVLAIEAGALRHEAWITFGIDGMEGWKRIRLDGREAFSCIAQVRALTSPLEIPNES